VVGQGDRSARSLGIGVALCLLAASLVTIGRALNDGTIGLVELEASSARHFIAFLIAGLPLAAAAFLYTRAYKAAAGEADMRGLLACAIAVQIAAFLALPLTSSDVFCNLGYGEIARLGLNPHSVSPSALPAGDPFLTLLAPAWRNNPSPYGPIVTELDRWAVSAESPFLALVVFKLEMLAIAVATVVLAYLFCGRSLPQRERAAAFVTLALCPLFAWEVAGQAHNDGLLVLFFMAYVLALSSGRRWLALAFLVLAIATKYVLAPAMIIHLAFLWRTSKPKAICAAVLLTVLGFLLVRPYEGGPALPASVFTTTGAHHHTRSLVSLACFLAAPFGSFAETLAYWIGWGIAVIGVVAATAHGALHAKSERDVIHGALVVLLACCLLAPWGQAWYATWLLPPAMVERDERWRRLIVLYAALSVGQYALQIDPVSYVLVSGVPLFMLYRLMRRPQVDLLQIGYSLQPRS
jgi:hypothetical protein